MPVFTHTPKVEPIEIDVDIDQFVDKCTHSEVRELMRVLKRDATGIYESEIEDDINDAVENALDKYKDEEIEEGPRSDGQRIFNYHLHTLKQEWYLVSKEDGDIIAILAKKYGAL
jgi:uncharacterized protein YicC (UPF0701 family)